MSAPKLPTGSMCIPKSCSAFECRGLFRPRDNTNTVALYFSLVSIKDDILTGMYGEGRGGEERNIGYHYKGKKYVNT